MGQALDREGNVLGAAEGATKQEVFDKLQQAHADAAEIRIRSGGESPDRMMQFFAYAHLPEKLQEASKPFCLLAEKVVATYPMNPERTVCLRKLLEAKDAAVRTLLYKS